MITEKDLQEAIAECQGQRNPNANTCIKLAAFYTIRRELFGNSEQLSESKMLPEYSYAPAPDQKPNEIVIDSDSEFARVIAGRKQEEVWPVMDELMDALKQLYPKLYNAVMDKLY